jgi:pimeloyl-ACP methyl ester carboxylesterase/putative sterol carrier protein
MAQAVKNGRTSRMLERVLRTQAETASAPEGLEANVALEVDEGVGYTVRIQSGTVLIGKGLPEEPAVRVITDPETLAAVIGGSRSGVHAFLRGDLRVRGNLALALQLDTMFGNGKRPVRWPMFRTVRAAGIRTSYLEAGRGEPVVMLHGLGATNASLLPALWDLARDHRVVAPDLPGFGESGKPIRSYHPRFYAGWLAAFMDQVGMERAHLIGNSMGGRVALEAGLEHPDSVDRMVLLAPSPAFIRNREYVRLVRVLRPELAMIPIRLSHRQVVRGIKGMFSRPERLPGEWYDAAADEFLRIFRTARGRVAFFSAARQIYLEEPHGEKGFWDRLPAMSRPALFVWGDRDRLVPAKFARHVERALPNSDAVVFEDCGHVPQYELPKRTNRLIRDFLGAQV